MWVLQVLFGGLGAFIFFICSLTCTIRRRPKQGLIAGILELIFAFISSSAWAWALKVSGKADWFLLGLVRYPAFGVIFYSMFAVGAICILASSIGIVKKRKAVNATKA